MLEQSPVAELASRRPGREGERSHRPRVGVVGFALVLSIALFAGSAAWAESSRRVGVVVALTVNATDERARELASALADAIAEMLVVDVVAGADAAAALPGAKRPDGCIADDACLRELAGRLEVDEVLAITIVEVGDRTQLEPTWLDPDGERSASFPAMAFANDEIPSELFRERAPNLVPDARRRAPDGEKDDLPDARDSDEVGDERKRPAAAGGSEAAPVTDAAIASGSAPPADGGRGRRMTAGAYAAAGVGAGALAGGVGFGLATRSLYRSCDAQGACAQADAKRIERRALVADGLFATALVAGGVTAALYWFSGSGGEREVTVSAGPGGLFVGGRF